MIRSLPALFEKQLNKLNVLSLARAQRISRLARRPATSGILVVALCLSLALLPGASPTGAAGTASQASISIYLNCPGSIALAFPATSGSCSSGNYTGVYNGIAEVPLANITSDFYLASATGGVKVTFSLTDRTSGKLLLSGVGYGAMAGGSCSSPTLVTPTKFTPTSNVINSGDNLVASLNTTFTGTGAPRFCSGGSDATLISFKTTVLTGTSQPLLSSLLTPGRPVQTTLGTFEGVAENYTNTGSVALTAIVQGIVKNLAGSTVGIISTSITSSPGATVTGFLTFKQYPSGSYTVTIVAITTSYVPISTTTVAQVSV